MFGAAPRVGRRTKAYVLALQCKCGRRGGESFGGSGPMKKSAQIKGDILAAVQVAPWGKLGQVHALRREEFRVL